jgi:hypothetical protein
MLIRRGNGDKASLARREKAVGGGESSFFIHFVAAETLASVTANWGQRVKQWHRDHGLLAARTTGACPRVATPRRCDVEDDDAIVRAPLRFRPRHIQISTRKPSIT